MANRDLYIHEDFIVYRGYRARKIKGAKYYKYEVFDTLYETLVEVQQAIDDAIEEFEESYTQLMESEG